MIAPCRRAGGFGGRITAMPSNRRALPSLTWGSARHRRRRSHVGASLMATVDLIVEGNQDVSAAARQVLVAVRQGGSPDAATASLVRAAEASSTKVQGVVTQGLAAYETEGVTGGAAADLVATALADLSQSNVLLAAGVALEGDADVDAESQAAASSRRSSSSTAPPRRSSRTPPATAAGWGSLPIGCRRRRHSRPRSRGSAPLSPPPSTPSSTPPRSSPAPSSGSPAACPPTRSSVPLARSVHSWRSPSVG